MPRPAMLVEMVTDLRRPACEVVTPVSVRVRVRLRLRVRLRVGVGVRVRVKVWG